MKQKIDWFIHARRNASLQHLSFLIPGLMGKGWLPSVNFHVDKYVVLGVPGKGGFIYLDNKELFNPKLKNIQKSVEKNKAFISDFRRKTDEIFGALFFWSLRIDEENLSLISISELEKLYKNYVEAVMISPLITVQVYGIEAMIASEYKIVKTLQARLKKLKRESEFDKYKEILLTNDGETVAFTERKDFLRVCVALDNKETLDFFNKSAAEIESNLDSHPEVRDLINTHIKKYYWVNTEYLGAGWTKQKWISLFKETLDSKDKKPKEVLDELLSAAQRDSEKKKKALKELNFSSDVIYAVDVLGEFLAQRDWTKGYFAKSLLSFHKVLREIARRMNISFEDILYYKVDEIIHYFRTGEVMPKKEFLQRVNNGYIMISKDGNSYFSSESSEISKLLTAEGIDDPTIEVKKEKEIRGLTASLGNIRGFVRIIDNPKKIPEFKDGEILVTYMTTIEFTPLFRKAKGVITDEGGMSCHAAIISREFKIPCIVGTKIGTRALKTGDEIELDANKGIVKIISKK